ncbi:DNA replication/repair protein RecF [Aquiluna sp.]|nr:DNA replication/repair protein RecF [Aquiluna sp.]MDA8901939.1 DNA replication/repair protein RecF [Aquiluna sp.]
MWLRSLQLTGYRNYEQLSAEFPAGPVLIVGENGEGKTNLVEAIGYLSTLESHRVAGYQSLIQKNQSSSQLSAKVSHQGREIMVGVELNKDRPNRLFLNGSQRKKTSEILGLIRTVTFAPEDLDLIRRDPSDRRAFMDSSLVQLKPRLAAVKSDYDRVLKQRNALLKSARSVKNPDLGTLDIWDDQLVALGTELTIERLSLVAQLEPLIRDFYAKLSASKEEVRLRLVSAVGADEGENFADIEPDAKAYANDFYQRLETLRDRELERGITLAGPHRDELVIEKAGLLAKSHASQGEAWSLALGLKLALGSVSRKNSSLGDPILLLDDVFAVLDKGRRQRLLEFVTDYEQVFITAADQAMAPQLDWAAELSVSKGVIGA